MKKKIIIFGATGYIARNLIGILNNDFDIVAVSRSLEKIEKVFSNKVSSFEWDYSDVSSLIPVINSSYAVINLTGENISAKRWTKKQKSRILFSRTEPARIITEAINKCTDPPEVLLQGSAIGYYRSRCSDSKNIPGFLSQVVRLWELELKLLRKDVRLVIFRTGVVIAKNAGIIQKLNIPFRLGFGGHIGNGRQWISWISLEDEINAIRFLLENTSTSGTYNLVAPEPVTMKEMAIEYGKSVRKKSWFHVPGFVIRIMFGQMGDEIILNGVKILPNKLLNSGFIFKNNQLESLLKS